MASLHKEVFIAASRATVRDAIRDIGALHTRLVPGVVVATRLEGEARVVTFGNGMVVREPSLSVDDERCRLAWSAVMQVVHDGEGRRVTWTSDLLPHEMAAQIEHVLWPPD